MATLLGSSITLDDSLRIIAGNSDDKHLSNVFFSIREDLIQGQRLGDAMSKYPDIFDNTYLSMISAGDTSGNLDAMFDQLHGKELSYNNLLDIDAAVKIIAGTARSMGLVVEG